MLLLADCIAGIQLAVDMEAQEYSRTKILPSFSWQFSPGTAFLISSDRVFRRSPSAPHPDRYTFPDDRPKAAALQLTGVCMQGATQYAHYEFLFNWPKRYGPIYKAFMGQKPYLVVTGRTDPFEACR